MTAISIQLDGETRNWSIGIYSEKFIVNLNYKQDWTVLCVSVGLLWLVVKILPGSSHSDIASVPEKQQPRVKGYQWTRRTRTVCSLVIQILLQNRSQLVNKWLSILILFYVNISWCRTVFVSRDFPSSCCPCAGENWIFICDSDLESGTEPNTRLRFWSLEAFLGARYQSQPLPSLFISGHCLLLCSSRVDTDNAHFLWHGAGDGRKAPAGAQTFLQNRDNL